jgi:hypothetical protein
MTQTDDADSQYRGACHYDDESEELVVNTVSDGDHDQLRFPMTLNELHLITVGMRKNHDWTVSDDPGEPPGPIDIDDVDLPRGEA